MLSLFYVDLFLVYIYWWNHLPSICPTEEEEKEEEDLEEVVEEVNERKTGRDWMEGDENGKEEDEINRRGGNGEWKRRVGESKVKVG